MARMPSCDAGARMFMMPASVNIDGSAVERKKSVTRTRPASGAEFGPPHDLREKGDLLQALVLNFLDGSGRCEIGGRLGGVAP